MNDWRNDWSEFVKRICADFEGGESADTVSSKYACQNITWMGRIGTKRLDDRPCIQMDMSPVSVRLKDGRHTVADHLNVRIAEGCVKEWQNVAEGTTVRFHVTLDKGDSLFPGLAWCDLGGGKGYLDISTRDGRLVDIVVVHSDRELGNQNA